MIVSLAGGIGSIAGNSIERRMEDLLSADSVRSMIANLR